MKINIPAILIDKRKELIYHKVVGNHTYYDAKGLKINSIANNLSEKEINSLLFITSKYALMMQQKKLPIKIKSPIFKS